MKPYIVFIPGLFGTSLYNEDELVWPVKEMEKMKLVFNIIFETPFNTLFPSKKNTQKPTALKDFVAKISNPDLKIGPVLSNYDKFIEFIKTESDNNYLIFGYDWRKSLVDSVEEFSKEIDKLEVGDREIVLIGHSLGGLLAYNYLSKPELYDKTYSNFCKIVKMISIGAPIQGSIKALSHLLGLSSSPLISKEDVKTLLSDGFLKPIFELCPINLGNLFYHKNGKNALSYKQIVRCLRKNCFHTGELENYIINKNIAQKQSTNNNVNYLFITGSYNTPMCTGFEVDVETNEISCIYDNQAGDGTVLNDESCPSNDNKFRRRTVMGKHEYLTEIDETQNIIREELGASSERNFYITGENLVKNNKTLEFKLFINKSSVKNEIVDVFAEHISFSNKMVAKDITKKFEKKKGNTFYFNTKYNYGFLRLRNAVITFLNSEGVSEKKFIKEIKIELEKIFEELL